MSDDSPAEQAPTSQPTEANLDALLREVDARLDARLRRDANLSDGLADVIAEASRRRGSRQDQRPEPYAVFIAELRALHKRCGKPAYRQLAVISENLSKIYPLPQSERYKYVPLSSTAISEILSGKRAKLPKFEWVVGFVLSCQQWAHRVGAAAEDPGRTSLPRWAKLWAAADNTAEAGAGDDHPSQTVLGSVSK